MAARRSWRRLLTVLAVPAAVLASGSARAASCQGTDAFGNVFTFSAVPDTLTFGETLGFTLGLSGTGTLDPAAGLDFSDGPRYGTVPDSGPAATAVEAPIAAFTPSSAPGPRTLLGYPIAGTHYFRTSRSAAVDEPPCVTTVSRNATTTMLSATPAVTTYGDTVRLGAIVSAATLPTGSVTFTDSGTGLGSATLEPRPVSATAALGSDHACMVTPGGGLSCWGENASGQLGSGSNSARTLSNAATVFSSGITGVAAGSGFSCAVKADETAACWGLGTSGQLGNNAAGSTTSPVTVANLAGIRTIVSGDSHACALTNRGAVWCWGSGLDGRLGTGSTANQTAPVEVISSGIVGIAAGRRHTCALQDTGGVSCWGSNAVGQAGLGASSTTPAAVSTLASGVEAIAAGGDGTCALMTDTTVRCWGDNTYGQVGDGSSGNNRPTPTVVSGLANAIALGVGDSNACAIKSDGTAVCWGRGDRGRIGDGVADVLNAPIRAVTTPKTVASFDQSASIFQLNGRANGASPDYRTRPAGIVVGGGRALVVSDLGAVGGWGALSVASAEAVADRLSPVSLLPARSVRLDAVASASTVAIAGGANRLLVASYAGDTNRAPSVSPSLAQAVSKAATAITGLTRTPSVIQFGDAVTLRATVNPAINEGVVEFFDGATVVGTASVVAGVAQTTTTTIPIGNNRAIGARYVENGNYLASTFASTVTVSVTRRTATLSIAADKTIADYGEAVRVTVSVVPAAATGQVVLINGSTSIGSATLSNGSAVFTLTTLAPGAIHTLRASYAGDANVDGDDSGTLNVEIRKLTVGLATGSSPATPRYGDQVTLTATITSPLTVGGTVTFSVAGRTATSAVPVNGITSASFTGIAAGTYTVTASFSGDAISFARSVTGSLTVQKRTPTFSLSAVAVGANPVVGETFALRATVTPSDAPGTITVTENATSLGNAALSGGFATVDISGASVGTHTYVVSMPETTNYNAASGTLSVTVAKGATTTDVTVSSGVYGESFRYVAVVQAVFPSTGTPTGSVRFRSNGTEIGTGILSNGVASYTATVAAIGSFAVTAEYLGSTDYLTSASQAITQTVDQATAELTLTPSSSAVQDGTLVSFTVVAAAQSPATGSPTGQVLFFNGSTQIGSANLSNVSGQMTATLTQVDLSIATHEITAIYQGDTNFLAGGTARTSVTVTRTPPTVTLTSSATTATYGDAVTLEVTIPSIFFAGLFRDASGSVTFLNGATHLSTKSLTIRTSPSRAATASVAISSLPVGTNTLTVYFGGSTLFEGATSNQVTVTVAERASVTSILLHKPGNTAASVSFPNVGETIAARVLVMSNGLTQQFSEGTVTLTDTYNGRTVELGRATVNPALSGSTSGAAFSFTLPDYVGTHSITASYSGGNSHTGSSAGWLAFVTQPSTVITVGTVIASNPALTEVPFGAPVSFALSVASGGTDLGTPTGTIVATGGVGVNQTLALTAGKAALSTAALALGANQFDFGYSGDRLYAASTTTASVTVVAANTATAITAPSAIVTGQATEITGAVTAVAPGAGTPSGTVTIRDENGPTDLGTATLVNGAYRFALPTLAPGAYRLRALFTSGAGSFNGSASATRDLVVGKSATVVTLAGPNTTLSGEAGTVTVAVAAARPGGGTPTGTVDLLTPFGKLATVTLAGGTATYTTTALPVGTHTINAIYQGDGGYLTGASTAYTLSVLKAPTTTVMTAPTATVFGETATLSATVATSSPASGTPGGTVTFMEGSRPIGSAALQAGVATITTAGLTAGPHSVQANYGGDGSFKPSVSALATQTVAQATSTTQLTAPVSAVFGERITLTATVTPAAPSAAVATGSVLFRLDGTLIASVNLDGSGKASTTATLAPGRRKLTAAYLGTAGVAASQSAETTVTVGAGATTVALAATATAVVGQPVTLAATVTPVAPAAGVPTGTVEFRDGATLLGTATLSRGAATFTTTALPIGDRTLTATYVGDGNFAGATSADMKPSVGVGPVIVTLSAPATRALGEPVVVTASVRAVYTAAGTPGGFVTVRDGPAVIGRVALVNGQATVSTAQLAVGAHTFGADYEGDTKFAPGTASASTTVGKAATTLSLTAPSSPVVGQPITVSVRVLTTTVTPVQPTGAIDIFDGSTRVAGGTIAAGVATVPLGPLAIGRHSLTAVYQGDASFTGSSSAPVQSTVGQGAVTATLAVAPAGSVAGQPVTITANVTAAAPAVGSPSGAVTIRDGSVVVGTAPLSGGTATVTLPAPTAGSHALSLSYPGDASFLAGTANLGLTVAKASTTVALTGPSAQVFGARATYTVTVAPVAPGAGTPGGKVVFLDGAAMLGSVTLFGGTGTFSLTTLAAGDRSITAAYQGDAGFLASTSAPLVTTVSKAATTLALTASAPVVRPGGSVTLTAQVQAPTSAGVPTGSVSFTREAAPAGTAVLSLGKATLAQAMPQSGVVALAARYPGTGNLEPSEGQVSVTVDASVGVPVPTATSTTGLRAEPAAARLASGGAVVAWTEPDASGTGVYARRYLTSGTAGAAPARANTATAGNQAAPAVAGLEGGGYIVVWQSTGQDASGTSIHFQRYGASGGLTGGETRANATTAGDQKAPAVTGLVGGGFAIAWTSRPPGGTKDKAFIRFFGATGLATTGEIEIDPAANDQDDIVLAGLAGGRVAVGWSVTETTTNGVKLRLFAGDGGPVTAPARIGSVKFGTERTLSVAATADGGFVLAYAAELTGRPTGVIARRFTDAGVAVGTSIAVGPASSFDEREPMVAAFPGGGFVVGWTADGATRPVVGYQRYRGDGTRADQPLTIVEPAGVDLGHPVPVVRTDTAFDVVFTTSGANGAVLRGSFALGAPAP